MARHLPAYLRHPEVSSVTVYDQRPDRASRAAATGGVPWTDGLEAFLDQRFDAVSVCTSPWSHAELAIMTLEHGSHVLTEKPMAMSTSDAQAMVAAADHAQRVLCVSHNFLFSDAARQASHVMAKGGDVQLALAVQLSSFRRRLPEWYPQLPGGLLFDELPHMLYLLQHYLGHLSLESARRPESSAHPNVVELSFLGAAPAQLTTAFESPVSEWHITLVGSRRVVDLDLFRDFASWVGPDDDHGPLDILKSSVHATLTHWGGFARSGSRLVTRRQSWGHDRLIAGFIDSVLGRAPSPVPPSDAVAVVALTDAILAELGIRA
jgi:predicted dehydrogenase